MRTLTHTDWQMDISHILLNEVDENSYFKDDFFVKYTYPFDFYTADYPQFIHHYNVSNYQKVYDGLILNTDGKLEEARLNILTIVGSRVSAQLIVGFENFPNFDKKLSELPLHNFKLSESLYSHAEKIMNQKYPETDYNFPAVHTNIVNTSTHLFTHFKNTFNCTEGGKMLVNSKAGAEIYNYNLIHPGVYFLYILRAGFADAGFVMKGNVPEDPLVQKLCIFKGNTYSDKSYPDQVEWYVHRTEYTAMLEDKGAYDIIEFNLFQEINYYGKFRVVGSVDLDGDGPVNAGGFKFAYNGVDLAYMNGQNQHIPFDFVFVNDPKSGNNLQLYGILTTSHIDRSLMIANIIPLEIYKEDGSIFDPTLNLPEINLKNEVPDVTFGDFVKAFKNILNFDLERVSKDIYVNFIESELKNIASVRNMEEEYQVSEPKVTFNEAVSFMLKYNFESDDYTPESIYVDSTGAKTSGYSKLQNTIDISSTVIPMPRTFKNNLNSAKTVSESDTDIQVLIYDGLVDGKNEAGENTPLRWTELYKNYWKEWLEFRLNAISFNWIFKNPKELFNGFSSKTKIRAYNRIHIIKKLSRQDIDENTEEIEIETFSE